jgi:putative tryptophan/tyrosine transport system substrate-binding protein
MRRRAFLLLLGAPAVAWSRVVRAQPADRPKRLGILIEFAEGDPEARARLAALREGLTRLSWIEGGNLGSEIRFGAGDITRIRTLAADLAAWAPDVILGSGAPVTAALKQATRTVPIVFVQASDPVGAGIVPSLGRPGGNITGFTNFEYAMVGKWLEVLKDLAPHITRVLLIQNPANFGWPGYRRAMEAAAPAMNVRFTLGPVLDAATIEQVIGDFARESEGGLMILPDTTTTSHRELIVRLAAHHALPAVYPFRFFADAGGLASYGIDVLHVFRSAASYIDRILRGEKPGDLPVQAASKFQLIINLRTARALKLAVSSNLLIGADEVIE